MTFDTGGISLCRARGMDEMKYDMCGAASVLGTLRACAELKLPLNVTGLIPAVENMPGGGPLTGRYRHQPVRPDHRNSQYRRRRSVDPVRRHDLRRARRAGGGDRHRYLTGACIIALGRHPHGLLSNHPPLAHALTAAGHTAADRGGTAVVGGLSGGTGQQFRRYGQYRRQPGWGAIMAACLSRFAKTTWAHLDIAGTAWKTGKAKGATGRPVPLLTQYLLTGPPRRSGRMGVPRIDF